MFSAPVSNWNNKWSVKSQNDISERFNEFHIMSMFQWITYKQPAIRIFFLYSSFDRAHSFILFSLSLYFCYPSGNKGFPGIGTLLSIHVTPIRNTYKKRISRRVAIKFIPSNSRITLFCSRSLYYYLFCLLSFHYLYTFRNIVTRMNT